MRLLRHSLLILSGLFFLYQVRPITPAAHATLVNVSGSTVTRPEQCEPGKTSPTALNWRWAPNTLIMVYYLKGDFSRAETEALSRAVGNWNNALKEISSNVVFVIGGEHESIVKDHVNVTVRRGATREKKRVGETKLFSSMASGRLVRGVITMSPAVTDLNALTSLMTHELGHSLGLADCYGCQRGSTAMAAFHSKNKDNKVYQPSPCDKYVVAEGYIRETTKQMPVALSH